MAHAGDAWHLRVSTHGFAQFLHIEDPCFTAEDDWLHLLPGREAVIRLRPLPANTDPAPPYPTAKSAP